MIVAGEAPLYIDAMKRHTTVQWRRVAAAYLALTLAVGCAGDGTSPDGQSPTVTFTPAQQGQEVAVGGNIMFAVVVEPEAAMTVTWRRGATIVGSAREYTYLASLVGRDTLRVRAESAETPRDYFWVIDVAPEPQTAPPTVPSAAADPGPDPSQVVFSWTRVSVSTYPIVDYVIAVSYSGPVTPQNWDAASVLGNVPHIPGRVGYNATFDGDHDHLVPGAEAWFAIRARDDRGQLSTGVTSRSTRITTEWWINGRVIDDAGNPLATVSVRSLVPGRSGNSEGTGRFRLGPYRSIDSVTVKTTSDVGYYDLTTARLNSSVDIERDLVLPGKYGVDSRCTAYGGDFLDYLRDMTNTEPSAADTAASRLWKWDHYPVSVFLPDSVTATGRHLDDLTREMMELWNTKMGETYLVPAASPASADVCVTWMPDISSGYGEAGLELPVGGVLGTVVPIRMRVKIAAVITEDAFFKEVALHEFGHVLGLVDHSFFCTDAHHLMLNGGAGGNLLLPDPIHPDEIRAVRTIRRLAQGVDMRSYEP